MRRTTNMRKLSIVSFVMALLMLVLCACSTTAEVTSESDSSESSAVTATPKPTPEMKTIGEKTDSETAVSLEVKNYTGETITSWKVKLTGEDTFSEDMLEAGDPFLQNTSRMLIVDPKNQDSNRLCDLEVAFEDATATIHNFPLDDADYVELRKEDNVVYLIYKSLTAKKEVNTLEDEQAAFEAAEAEKAAESAKSATFTTNSGSGSSSYSGGSSSSSGSSGNSGSSGYSEPVSGGGSESYGESGSDDGCIGDEGLMY